MTIFLNHALRYAEHKWPIFPVHSVSDKKCTCTNPDCSSAGKHPRIKNGLHGATTNVDQINKWWTSFPDANIGLVTGPASGLVVLDVDPRHNGDQSLEQLENQYGKLPETYTAATGGGGLHYFFEYPGEKISNSTNRVGNGLDIRGDGGYVVAPPSVHVSGGRYQWLGPRTLAPMPEWIKQLAMGPVVDTTAKTTAIVLARDTPGGALVVAGAANDTDTGIITEGRRNSTLASIAGKLRHRGHSEQSIFASLCMVNRARCRPPLLDRELAAIARSVSRYPAGNPSKSIVVANEWPEPESLDTELLPVMPFKEDLLPLTLRPWLLDCANRIQTPLEFVAIPAIVSLGSVIGRQVGMRPLEFDDWTEYPNLWGALIGPPSERKSPALGAALAPIDKGVVPSLATKYLENITT